jgi:hypothetical protein
MVYGSGFRFKLWGSGFRFRHRADVGPVVRVVLGGVEAVRLSI